MPVTQPIDHPSETDLTLLLGAELKSRKTARISRHLQRCRKCRSQLRALEAGMRVFEEYERESPLPAADLIPPIGGAVRLAGLRSRPTLYP